MTTPTITLTTPLTGLDWDTDAMAVDSYLDASVRLGQEVAEQVMPRAWDQVERMGGTVADLDTRMVEHAAELAK